MKPNRLSKRTKSSHRSVKTGLPPGSLVYIGKNRTVEPDLFYIRYGENELDEFPIKTKDIIPPDKLAPDKVNWLMVNGIHDTNLISHLGDLYQFDSLILEDILNTEHRPKFEELDSYIFLTIKSLTLDNETLTVNSEQISLLTGANYLISFQENHNALFNSIIDRIKLSRGKIRYKQEDYLMYALLDVVVDNYFEIIETIGQNLEDLEDEIYANPGKDDLQKIQLNKKALLTLQKVIFPLRDEIGSLLKSECKQINPGNRKYFRDVYDHLFHMGDSIENLLEINSSVKDIYLSNLSLKMNRIIQTLTIFTAVFTPLTFLAGLYGMNFQYMPELSWRYGYFILLGIMAISAVSLIIYLRRKKWL